MNENLQYLNDLFAETIANFELMLDRRQISEDEFNQYKANAYLEYQERVAELFDVQPEDIEQLEEAASYSDDAELATFSVGSGYAATLLEIAAPAYYDEDTDEYDIEGLCVELGNLTDNDPEDVLALLQGEIEPSDEFTLLLSEQIGLDEEAADALLIAGIEARGESIEDYLEDESDEDEPESEYDPEASYSNNLESRVEFAEQELARSKAERIISNELSQIEKRVWELVEEGKCTPHVANFFLGEFDTIDDQIAAFSTTCSRNRVEPSSQLHGMKMVVRVLEQLPELAKFGYDVREELTDAEIEEDERLNQTAEQFIKAWNNK